MVARFTVIMELPNYCSPILYKEMREMRKVKAVAMSLVCAAVLMAASSAALANTPPAPAGKAKSCCGKNHSKACCKKKNAKCCKPKMKM